MHVPQQPHSISYPSGTLTVLLIVPLLFFIVCVKMCILKNTLFSKPVFEPHRNILISYIFLINFTQNCAPTICLCWCVYFAVIYISSRYFTFSFFLPFCSLINFILPRSTKQPVRIFILIIQKLQISWKRTDIFRILSLPIRISIPLGPSVNLYIFFPL